ncbi:hypothetical protein DENSPDRAFT_798616 [Dentipellis sp. KUC8613]|nr:hypothetical protein DENSPDRAFT_798616 [Dentipellis sp. KUC8613]
MPATTQSEIDALYSKIQRRMVESGEWERIRLLLSYRLNDAGWIDTARGQSSEHAHAMEPLSFRQLLEHISPSAKATVPESVRAEVMVVIRRFLEEQFDSR